MSGLFLTFLLMMAGPAQAADGQTQGDNGDVDLDAVDLTPPAINGRSVFVTQVGAGNDVTVRQSVSNARAEVTQRGDANTADATQRDTGTTYLRAVQTGDANRLGTVQAGTGSGNLWIDQTGDANRVAVAQTTYGALYNGAVIAQNGSGNDLSLIQNGDANRAVLAQNGDNNTMTAVQNGSGNQLAWAQQGSGLSDLGIVQNGGQSLMITQTGGR